MSVMLTSPTFGALYLKLQWQFKRNAKEVRQTHWQGVDVSKRPEMVAYELPFVTMDVPLNGIEDLDHWRNETAPNLPWADDHFEERVCGEPINPGVEHANWPWGKSAAGFMTEGQYCHNYMERLWPKYAGIVKTPTRTAEDYVAAYDQLDGWPPNVNVGIRGVPLGDLSDLVKHLVADPLSRQAAIPLYFPEDIARPGRKPCTMYYQFMMRDDKLSIMYPLRSCDFIRHFRDDVYMAIRLLLWVLDECRKQDNRWNSVRPGSYNMHASSLHVFKNDWNKIVGE